MTADIIGLVVLILIFAIASIRNVNMGALAFVGAFGVGMLVVHESIDDVLGGFPVDGLMILLGITFLFGIARSSGAIEWLVNRSVDLIGDRPAFVPWVMYLIATFVACLGTPHAAFTVVPIAMSLARKHQIHPTLMGIFMGAAIVGGGFAPTSLLGIITATAASSNGVPFNPFVMFFTSVGFSTAAAATVFFMFGGVSLITRTRSRVQVTSATSITETQESSTKTLTKMQGLVLFVLVLLIASFLVLTIVGIEVNLGSLALTAAVVLALIDPELGKQGFKQVDWGTIVLLSGILTYIDVLARLGAVDQLGEWAGTIEQPLMAAAVICVVGALVSAFASTIGILGVLIPLAVPFIGPEGALASTGFLYALAISASLVDCAPFSTTGATIVAGAEGADRPRLTKHLTVWGLAMVIVGPALTLLILVVPGLLLS